ncbi:hypothetical protein K438DRAFT_796319 [Mycena galopus ATCC 62051]|nr:hypothetical protein K438DRAFT_796319 [Mycena galopus ATCC 62051]
MYISSISTLASLSPTLLTAPLRPSPATSAIPTSYLLVKLARIHGEKSVHPALLVLSAYILPAPTSTSPFRLARPWRCLTMSRNRRGTPRAISGFSNLGCDGRFRRRSGTPPSLDKRYGW